MKSFIEECLRKCLAGERLSRDEMIRLLDVEPGGADDEFLREAAREASLKITGGKGYIW